MLRGNIATTSLKMLLKNLYSVKCYDKLNMNVLTLSLWENFWWGLIYFDQFMSGSGCSGLDKDLDQWVFHPLLFNLMSILLHI